MAKTQQRCIFCARLFDIEYSEIDTEMSGETTKIKSICPLCEARLRKEAEDSQTEPKPI